MKKDIIGKDKRRFLRFDASLGMKYKTLLSKAEEGIATLRNISRSGMGFSVIKGEILPTGTSANFEIDVPGEGGPIFAKGKIVWSKEIFPENVSLLTNGVEFVDITPIDKGILLDYAYNQWVKKEL